MSRVVRASLEEPGGLRCVDILEWEAGAFGYVECRRDPEDGHGWRAVSLPVRGYGSREAALRAARSAIGWLGAGG